MALSEDMPSVTVALESVLGMLEPGEAGVLHQACLNLSALIEQVQMLEGLPLALEGYSS